MKKHLLLLTVFFSLLISNVFSQTVYITKTGKKYHNANCTYLRSSSFPINLSDALARGLDACSVCKPSSSTNQSSPATNQTIPTQNQTQSNNPSQNQSSQSKQCSATTKAGKQCSRMTNSSNGKCWQHGGN